MSRPTVSRTSIVCSSGKDKHTYDSERADPPQRSVCSEPPSEVSSLSSLETESLVKRDSVVRRLDVRHPLRSNGKYHNPWPTWDAPSLAFNLLRFGRHAKIPSKQELDRTLPVLEPDFK
ncbi:unnamed protein product, partial [Medioppia subpectinata]